MKTMSLLAIPFFCAFTPFAFAQGLGDISLTQKQHVIRVANDTDKTILRIRSGSVIPQTRILLPGQKTGPLKNSWLNHMEVEFLARGSFMHIPHCHHSGLSSIFHRTQLLRVEDSRDDLGIPVCQSIEI